MIDPYILAEEVLRVVGEAEDASEARLLPGVPREDGVVIAALAFAVAAAGGETAADLGAGAGVSSAWIAYGFSRGCAGRECTLYLVDIDDSVLGVARGFASRLSGGLRIEVRVERAASFLKSVDHLDFVFVDVAKECYPQVLESLEDRLTERGLVVFHNALYPPPPREFYEMLESRGWLWALIPTRLGLLVARPPRGDAL